MKASEVFLQTIAIFLLTFVLTECGAQSNQQTNLVDVFTDLRPGEKNAIEKVKSLVGGELYRPYMKTDKYLVRWVRDANLKPSLAAERIRKFHEYRKRNKIDTILSENMDLLEIKFPHEILAGVDNEGGAILIFSIGKWDIRKQVLTGGTEKFRRYIDYCLEKCDVVVRNTKAVNGTAIINMQGYSLKTTACIACIPQILYFVNRLETHYPQIAKHFYLINTPKYFDPLLRIILPLLSAHTSSVLKVYGYDKSEWVPVLMSKIPADLLPGQYGGTRKD